jgi:hypothetical protein
LSKKENVLPVVVVVPEEQQLQNEVKILVKQPVLLEKSGTPMTLERQPVVLEETGTLSTLEEPMVLEEAETPKTLERQPVVVLEENGTLNNTLEQPMVLEEAETPKRVRNGRLEKKMSYATMFKCGTGPVITVSSASSVPLTPAVSETKRPPISRRSAQSDSYYVRARAVTTKLKTSPVCWGDMEEVALSSPVAIDTHEKLTAFVGDLADQEAADNQMTHSKKRNLDKKKKKKKKYRVPKQVVGHKECDDESWYTPETMHLSSSPPPPVTDKNGTIVTQDEKMDLDGRPVPSFRSHEVQSQFEQLAIGEYLSPQLFFSTVLDRICSFSAQIYAITKANDTTMFALDTILKDIPKTYKVLELNKTCRLMTVMNQIMALSSLSGALMNLDRRFLVEGRGLPYVKPDTVSSTKTTALAINKLSGQLPAWIEGICASAGVAPSMSEDFMVDVSGFIASVRGTQEPNVTFPLADLFVRYSLVHINKTVFVLLMAGIKLLTTHWRSITKHSSLALNLHNKKISAELSKLLEINLRVRGFIRDLCSTYGDFADIGAHIDPDTPEATVQHFLHAALKVARQVVEVCMPCINGERTAEDTCPGTVLEFDTVCFRVYLPAGYRLAMQ